MVLFCDVLFHFKYHKGLSNSTSRCSVGARDCGGFPIPTMTKIDPPFLQLPIKLFVPPGLAVRLKHNDSVCNTTFVMIRAGTIEGSSWHRLLALGCDGKSGRNHLQPPCS